MAASTGAGTQWIQSPPICKGWKPLALPRGCQGKLGLWTRDRRHKASEAAREEGCHAGSPDHQRSALATPRCPHGWPSCTDCACNQALILTGKGIKRERKSAGERQAAPTPASPLQSTGQRVRGGSRAQHKAPARPRPIGVPLSEPPTCQGWLVGSSAVHPREAARPGASRGK